METLSFKKLNTYSGWAVFTLALTTYWLTFEETGSYWDCGEFIAVAYKLEVSHPPGAPLFMLLGRLFSFLAMGDGAKVGYWINSMSVLASAFTILFLFWSIVLLGKKMIAANSAGLYTREQSFILIGAGAVGALAFTFTDSFWFSAVEAEVYALSSFFTAFVVWGVLRWETIENGQQANRWLIFVAYLVGLSIGVHLLNLVTLPALGLVFYFKRYSLSIRGLCLTLVASLIVVFFINNVVITGLPTMAGSFELFFVNDLGLPFGSGVFVFVLLLISAFAVSIFYTHRTEKYVLNTMILCAAFIVIGYCSYATIVIRSNFDPSINENAPKDVMSFVRYLRREQYGTWPIAKGPYFTAKIVDIEYGDPVYIKGKDKYEFSERKFSYVYEPEQVTTFPRAWNSEHAAEYRRIMGLREGQKPTFIQNLGFMFKHQIGVMYLRYVMWNLAGRESDIQGAGWLHPAQWGEKLPYELAINRGRNNYFMIPFVLGLIGMLYQARKDMRSFTVVALLFIMMGVAIVVYLNPPPVEPRERDYIYAGSIYAFTFWIGFAFIALADFIRSALKNATTAIAVTTLICLTAPLVLAVNGWDDHNRSNRFFSVDSAKNYLDSCAPNAILFTGGDNDTFPLWYVQEVEGYRTDVRVVVLSYYNTDWYIDQSMHSSYESDAFPYSLSLNQYRQGGPNDYLPYKNLTNGKPIDLKQYIGLLAKDYPQLRVGESNVVPSKMLTLTIDPVELNQKKLIPKGIDSIVSQMNFRLKGNMLWKKDLAFLDLVATNNWERPIYLTPTSKSQMILDLEPYVISEGNAFRVFPVRRSDLKRDFVNTEIAFENMINKFHYRNLHDPNVYYNEDYRNFVLNQRSSFNSLAQQLIDEYDDENASYATRVKIEKPAASKLEQARKTLLFSLEKMPDRGVPFDITGVTTVDLLFKVGENKRAAEMGGILADRAVEMANYLIGKHDLESIDLRRSLYEIGTIYTLLLENQEKSSGEKYEQAYRQLIGKIQAGG